MCSGWRWADLKQKEKSRKGRKMEHVYHVQLIKRPDHIIPTSPLSRETKQIVVIASDLTDARKKAEMQLPDGWRIDGLPVRRGSNSGQMIG
jgi:hypothetical protein